MEIVAIIEGGHLVDSSKISSLFHIRKAEPRVVPDLEDVDHGVSDLCPERGGPCRMECF